MFNFLKKKYTDIDISLKEFYVWKVETKGVAVALEHKEVIVKFIMMTYLTSMNDCEIGHIHQFKDWVLNHYASDYMIEKHMHSVRCFLRFCRRYDIIAEMTKLGRKPNLEMIKAVKDYRKKDLTYRELQKLLEAKYGRAFNLKTLNFWGNYKK